MPLRNRVITTYALVGTCAVATALATGVAEATPRDAHDFGWTVRVFNDVPNLPGLEGRHGPFSNVRDQTDYIQAGNSGLVVGAVRDGKPLDIDFRYRDGRQSDIDGGVNVQVRWMDDKNGILTCLPDWNSTLECTAGVTTTTKQFQLHIW